MKIQVALTIVLILIVISSIAQENKTLIPYRLHLQVGTITNVLNIASGSSRAQSYALGIEARINKHSNLSLKSQWIRYYEEGFYLKLDDTTFTQDYINLIQHIDITLQYRYAFMPDKKFNISYLLGAGVAFSDFVPDATFYNPRNPRMSPYTHEVQPVIDPAIELRYNINSSLALSLSAGMKFYPMDFYDRNQAGMISTDIYWVPYFNGGLSWQLPFYKK